MDYGPVNVFYVPCLSQIVALGESVLSAPHGCASNEVLNLDPWRRFTDPYLVGA